MVSRTLAVAGATILLLLAGCSAPLQTGTPAGAPANATGTTISVDATADASAPPDLALVHVAVVSTAADANAARRRTAENASSMRDALRASGIDADGIHTTYYNLDAVHGDSTNGSRITGYRAVHGFEIEAGVDAAGSVVDTAVANGANRVEGVTFTLTTETRRTLRREALGRAMTNARGDADAIANASGVSITSVRSASTSDLGVQPFEARVAGGGGGTSTTIEPGPVRVSATVSVTYRAERG
ncbi:MAG: SIMPL domain-containing protein [Haloferacaceae archaeon]